MTTGRGLAGWTRRTLSWYLAAKIILAVAIIAVSAATITASTANFQAELGSAYNVTNHVLIRDEGFSRATANTTATGTCPAGNVTFGVLGTANNAITAGDIIYDVQVNATALTPVLSCFTVTLTLSISGSTTTETVTIASAATVSDGQAIDCKLDIGTTNLPASPFSFQVTVQ